MKWSKSKLITGVACFVALFSIGYAGFQHYHHAKQLQRIDWSEVQLSHTVGTSLPDVRLVDLSGNAIKYNELRQGKVILVLLSSECDACLKEGQFLKSVVDKYPNIRFYSVLIFWSDQSIDHFKDKFPLKLFLDQDSRLRQAFEVKAVPVKLFLEDGVIRKTWIRARFNSRNENEFVKDLETISGKTGS